MGIVLERSRRRLSTLATLALLAAACSSSGGSSGGADGGDTDGTATSSGGGSGSSGASGGSTGGSSGSSSGSGSASSGGSDAGTGSSSGSGGSGSSGGTDSGPGDDGSGPAADASDSASPESGTDASADAVADSAADSATDGAVTCDGSQAYLGVKITFNVTWGMGGASPASSVLSPGGPSPATLWFLLDQTGGTTFAGTAGPCGAVLPAATLNTVGDVAVGATPLLTEGLVQFEEISNATFDGSIVRTYAIAGTQGFNPGGSIAVQATTTALGLAPSSTYAQGTSPWPAYCPSSGTCTGVTCTAGGTCSGGNGGPFPGSVITDDDSDFNPGVSVVPPHGSSGSCTGSCSYYYPPLAVGGGTSPQADEVYLAQRARFSLSLTRAGHCSSANGTATITLFDDHVVGCHVLGGADCSSAQVSFLDMNRVVYVDANGNAFSSSSPTNGTASAYQFPQGSTPTCAAVRAALP